MYGMALLGIVPQVPARRIIERVKTGGDERNAPAAPENAAEPFGGDAAEAGPREAGADVLGSPKAGEPRQGRLQFGEAGGRPQLGYIIYGADGNPVGTSREPAILPTSGGIYYDSYASAFARRGAEGGGRRPAFSDGRKVYAILPVESDGRVFYYAAEYDPQAGRRNVELLENPPQGAGGVAGPEWLGAQMEAFIEKRRENPDAGPRPYASEPFAGADGVENVPINFAIGPGAGKGEGARVSAEAAESAIAEANEVLEGQFKESKRRSAAKSEVDREKYIRDNMPEWKDNPGAFDEEDYAKGYRNYWNRRGYGIDYTPEDGWYSVVDENGDSLKDFRTLEEAEEYALERWWDDNVYDELDYKEDYNEDNPQNLNRKKFEYAAKRIGVDVLRHEEAFTGSEYVWIKLPNGLEKKIRFADHPQVYSADMSVENSWEDAFRFLVERLNANDWDEDYNDGDFVSFYSEPAAEETEDARVFRSELAKVEAGTLPTYKILKLGRPSETLLGIGVPDRPISLRQSVIKKILEKHGLGYDLISKLPEAINDPIAIFSYPKNENVRDILLELRDKNGRAIMASLKLNVSTQRYGEVSDLATVHPKENIGRIYDWIKKGRLLYWDKQKGRKFLQDSALIKLEQYGTELSPLFPPSENASESQGGNLNFYAEPRVSEGRPADAGGGYVGAERGGIPASARAYGDAAESIEAINAASARAGRWKAENDAGRGIKRRGVLRKISDRVKLPSGVKLDKKTGRLAGIANPAEIRRYLAKALDVGVYSGMDVARHKNALGTYSNLLEIIRLRGGHINDMNVVGHELGHHLERLMFDFRLPDADTPLKGELERFCVSRFGSAYPPNLRAREGWAQFVSEWIADPRAAEGESPIAGAAMSQLSLAFPKIGKILDNAREMLALWQNADPNARAEANIKFSDEARPRESEGVAAFLKRLYGQGQLYGADRLYGLKNAQRIVSDRTGKSADFYERARTMKGAASENSQWSREVRQTDLSGAEIGESLEEICAGKNTGVSLRRFEAYLVARRAMVYYRKNPEESADTCRAKFGNDYATLSKVEDAATEKMKFAARKLDNFQKNSLKLLLDGGVIDEGAFERLSAQRGYVPLRRIMEELDAAESAEGGGGLKKPLKNFRGSDREIISPIAQIADNEQFFRQLAVKNRLYFQIVDSVSRIQRGGELLSGYKDTAEKININYKEFAKSLAKSEFAREIAELDGIDWSNERELVAFACFSGAPKRKMSGCCAVLRRL